jgi:hypothetical protein
MTMRAKDGSPPRKEMSEMRKGELRARLKYDLWPQDYPNIEALAARIWEVDGDTAVEILDAIKSRQVAKLRRELQRQLAQRYEQLIKKG